MAQQQKFVMGNFTNKVGQVVGSNFKGVPVVRAKPARIVNPRSKAQQTSRLRFRFLTYIATSALAIWISRFYTANTRRMGWLNAWIREHSVYLRADGSININDILHKNGRLLPPTYQTFYAGVTYNDIVINRPPIDPLGLANDEIWHLQYSYANRKILSVGKTAAIRGTTGTTSIRTYGEGGRQNTFWFWYYQPSTGYYSKPLLVNYYNNPVYYYPPSSILLPAAHIAKIDKSEVDTTLDMAGTIAVEKEAFLDCPSTYSDTQNIVT